MPGGKNMGGPRSERETLHNTAVELFERVIASSVALEEDAKQLLEGHGLSGCARIMRGYIAGNDATLAKARGEQ